MIRVGIDATFWRPGQAAGIETVLVNTLLALDSVLPDDIACCVLTTEEGANALRKRLTRIRVHAVGPRGHHPIARLLREQFGVAWSAWRTQLDILHSVNYFGPLVVPARLLITLHDCNIKAVPDAFGRVQRVVRRALTRMSVWRARAVLTVSYFSKSEIHRYYGPTTPVIVVSNAPDERLLQAGTVAVPDDGDYFLAVGSSHPHKNLRALIAAYIDWRSRDSSRETCELRLVGLGRRGAREVTTAASETVGVRILGYVEPERLASLYKGARALVFPSLYEGFGLPPIEAMALGCPVIASGAAAIPEVVGDAAILVDANSPARIVDAMEQIADSGVRQRLVIAGSQQAQKYSWAQSAQTLLSVYRSYAVKAGRRSGIERRWPLFQRR